MWQSFVGSGIMSWLGNQTGKAQAEIDTRLSAANAKATNQVNRARNAETMARNSLSRYVQSVNNNRMLDDGGDAFTANLITSLRGLDNEVNQRLLSDVRTMEEFGAAVATQAGSGASGQVVDMINSTTALRSSISRELAQQSTDSAVYEVSQRSQSIMAQMIGGLDGSLIIDGLDTSQAFAQQRAAPTNGQAIFAGVLGTAIKAGVGNVAEWGQESLKDLGWSGAKRDFGSFLPEVKFGDAGSGALGKAKFSFNPNVKFGG